MEDNYPESTATFEESGMKPSCASCHRNFKNKEAVKQHWSDTRDGDHQGDPEIEYTVDDSEARDTGHYTNWNR